MSVIPVTKTSGEAPDIEPGVYAATCVRVADDTLETPQYGDGNIVRLYMVLDDVLDAEGEPIELDAIANRKLSPKAKLTRWAEALGRPIDFEAEIEFDTEELVGGICLAKIIHKDGSDWPRVDDLTARPKAGGKVSPANGSISDWWQQVRSSGLTVREVTDKAVELFDAEPKDLTNPQRAEVVKALT